MPTKSLLLLAATAVVVAGCGSSSSTPSGRQSAARTAVPAPSAPATSIGTATTKLGKIVVDGAGRTLYLFAKDTGPKSTCSGACATSWPPVTAAKLPRAGRGLSAAALSLIRRSDGTRQVALGGHPLYRFAGDSAAGQLNGQGIDGFGAKWFVLAPSGAAITKAMPSPKPKPQSSPSPYGY